MTSAILTQLISEEQLARYAGLIYDKTGISISPQKRTLLSNRLRRRMRVTGDECYDDYLARLKKLASSDPEWNAFLEEITTHETYLFRDPSQWQWFQNEFLPEMVQAERRGERRATLRIWSAASSTGDEAYTIASCIAGKLLDASRWKIEIVGTDIGVGALEKAKQAEFGERAMKHVPDSYRRRFFDQIADDRWKANATLTQWTSFRQHNLLHRLAASPFDLIFLKNVLIYFDAASKVQAMSTVDAALKPGGLLVTGPAEGVADQLSAYQRIHPWLHRKP